MRRQIIVMLAALLRRPRVRTAALSLVARLPAGGQAWLRRTALGLRGGPTGRVGRAVEMLWGGFSSAGVAKLEALGASPTERPLLRAEAEHALGTWYGARDDFAQAVKHFGRRNALVDPRSAGLSDVPYLLSLIGSGRAEDAAARIAASRWALPSTSMDFLCANMAYPNGAAESLAGLNRVYRDAELSGLALRDPSVPLSIDNLTGEAARAVPADALVTVIIPAYNCAATITTALRSLAEQTWSELEVIVVDDCSSDATADVVSEFASGDKRVRLIRLEVNGGAYVARNAGLAAARGRYVTTLDADDWAHPDRIRLHVEAIRRGKRPFNLSRWVRLTPNFFFPGIWRPEGLTFLGINMGSLFFERSVAERIGPWNAVRVSGDREFLRRAALVYGEGNTRVGDGAPLVLGRHVETSLTQTGATHLATRYHGVRRVYHEATDDWQRLYREGKLPLERLNEAESQSAPASIRPTRVVPSVDLLLVADWNMHGGTAQSAKNIAMAARRAGYSVAALHYPRSDGYVGRPLESDIHAFFRQNDILQIAAGEPVEAQTIVVTYPALLNEPLDLLDVRSSRRLVVLINQMAERDRLRQDVAYDIERVKANLITCFGGIGEWTPISDFVRGLMTEDPRYPRPASQTWTPLIDTALWGGQGATWRGDRRGRPVVGRHGRDHYLKWPGSAEALRAAYCVDKPCEVRILGGAAAAFEVLGRRPRNWTVLPFGAEDVQTFVAGLDFFIHYPHETYIEEFGRAPMEAMAAGVPVVLPPVFRATFGDAAIYAPADGVWDEIASLWANQQAWLARVEAGHRFVRENCSYDVITERLAAAPATV